MKYCEKCGTQVDETTSYCPICGNYMEPSIHNPNYSNTRSFGVEKKTNGFAIAGFVLSFLIPLLGWIFGGVGLSNVKKCNSGKGLSIAALIIATLNWFLSFLINLGIFNI